MKKITYCSPPPQRALPEEQGASNKINFLNCLFDLKKTLNNSI